MVFTHIPTDVTRQIVRACGELGLAEAPAFAPIQPAEGAQPSKCVFNVRHAARAGFGRELLGWKIAEWPGVLVEFIGHALLVTPDENRVCITPDRHGEKRVLFVPDATILFDFSDPNARLPHRLVAASTHEDVAAFIRIENESRDIRRKLPPQSGLVRITGPDADRMKRLELAQRRVIRDIALRTWPDSQPCVCDSGEPFRECCKPGMQAEKRGGRAG